MLNCQTAAAFCLAALTAIIAFPQDAQAQEEADSAFQEALATLEKRHAGGRLGVTVLNTATGERLTYRADERFAMASTLKLLLAAAVLSRVDAGTESLARPISYGQEDLLSYAPVTRAHLESPSGQLREEATLTVAALCAAAIKLSDNTAANLLIELIGGPAGFTHYARSIGDEMTRLDRNEPSLNENRPGDERDTTTPMAMARNLRRLLVGSKLSASSRARLRRWLIASRTGGAKLRAGLGPTWTVGNKTGAGGRGASNDVAIAWPPGGEAPIIITVYYSGAEDTSREEQSAVIAEVGGIVKESL